LENVLYFDANSNRRYRRLTEINLEFETQNAPTSNNRYNPNDFGSLRVIPIACGLETPKRHENMAFLSMCILLIFLSVIINNKYLLKYGSFSTFMHKFLVKTIGIISY